MNYKLSATLLSRDEVINEATNRCRHLEIQPNDTACIMGVVSEVVNAPYDTINHKLPARCISDINARSDYYYLLAEEVSEYLN